VKEFFASAELGLIGLLIFFTFFVAMLIWLYRPGTKTYYKNLGKIPLEDETHDRR
jgi:cbb3-type cytochrome oxidase subunit 3